MTTFRCSQVKRKAVALVPIFLLLFTCFISPVSAFYFDFQYFETDKIVYEVGETINMVAKLIADFSEDGWCYVSFAVVTDLGPAFADEYFIPPSPEIRYLNSSYTIHPDHTNPTVSGVQAFVLFNVEIFDTVSQGAGENIEITIVRGHLDTVPQTSLVVQSGIDTILTFKVESVHNSGIVYSNDAVAVIVEDADSQTVLDANLSTTMDGLVSLNWNDSLGPPGLYNLTLLSDGNSDFLPFSDSYQINVLPALSNLSILSAPVSIHCQSPDGNHVEQADILVDHRDLNLNPVMDSTVTWETSFENGTMINLGTGQYSASIPFQTTPGNQLLNITATNPLFQTVQEFTTIAVLPNSLQFSPVQSSWNATRGQDVRIDFEIHSELDWNQSVPVQFLDNTSEFSIESDIHPGTSDYLVIPVLSNYSTGLHTVNVSTSSEYYSFQNPSQFTLGVIGTLDLNNTIDSALYGETLNFTITILDDNNKTVDVVDILVYCDNDTVPFAFINNANTSISQYVSLPLWISPSFHNISFRVECSYYVQANLTMTVQVWMGTDIIITIT